ncbi:AAA family ATPase [Thermococcus sp.]|uniref:AAA family ATPase n=1 Tax=Thermococcus sp. TaxID=35749 RepID=UPI0026112150|nr:AAA family ATPase [Thermococcus sp.]
MEVWSIKDEKENSTSEGYLTAVVGEDFPQLPLDLGEHNGTDIDSLGENRDQGDLNNQMGNKSQIDYELLMMAIKKIVSPARNYELLPLLVLILHNKYLTRSEIRALSEKFSRELPNHFHNYSLKSINNALSSVLKNDSIVTMVRKEGNEYYILNERVRSLIMEEYSKLYLEKKEKEVDNRIMDSDEAVKKAVEILKSEYNERIKKLLVENPSGILAIDYEKVLSYSRPLAELIKYSPNEALNVFSSALEYLLVNYYYNEDAINKLKVTFTSDVTHRRLLDIDVGKDLNTLITIEAKIMAISKPQIFHPKLVFVCKDCGNEMVLIQEFLAPRNKPLKCDACGSRNIFIDVDKSSGVELVVFTLQDLLENLEGSEQAQEFSAFTIVEPKKVTKLIGQKVKVTGIVRSKIKLESEKSTTSDVIIEVLHVEELEQRTAPKLTQDDIKQVIEFRKKFSEEEIINLLIDSIAPNLYADRVKTPELWASKKASLLALVSSKQVVNNNRKWVNVLIIGDKGTGKSMILEDLRKLFHLELVTGGGGTSQVGLIGIAKNDEITGRWVYRAGALARANSSVLLIDEFDKLKDEEYKALHTVMSQGYYIFNKADLNVEVNTKESIIAVANPLMGVISNQKIIFEQVSFSKTLLDRFDIIIALRSYTSEEVLREIDNRIWEALQGNIKRAIDKELLVKYITYAQRVVPSWDENAIERLKVFVRELRKQLLGSGGFNYSPRLFVGMVNMSEAIAKLKLKEKVTVKDVDEAIELMTIAIKSWGEDVDFSILSELTYSFTKEERRLLNAVESTITKLKEHYPTGVPREELLDFLKDILGTEDDSLKALHLAMKVKLIERVGDNKYLLTRDM